MDSQASEGYTKIPQAHASRALLTQNRKKKGKEQTQGSVFQLGVKVTEVIDGPS